MSWKSSTRSTSDSTLSAIPLSLSRDHITLLHSCVQRINYVYKHRIPTEIVLIVLISCRMHAEKNTMRSGARRSFCDSWLCINVFEPTVAGFCSITDRPTCVKFRRVCSFSPVSAQWNAVSRCLLYVHSWLLISSTRVGACSMNSSCVWMKTTCTPELPGKWLVGSRINWQWLSGRVILSIILILLEGKSFRSCAGLNRSHGLRFSGLAG